MMSFSRLLVPCISLSIVGGCSAKQPKPTQAPEQIKAPPAFLEAKAQLEAEQEPEGPKEILEFATFNLQWAHNHEGDATSTGKKERAHDEAAWKWKVQNIAAQLAKQAPDVVALQELGGEDEVYDIIEAIKAAKGPEYAYAFVSSEDPFSGHQLAILSTFPLVDARRLSIHLRRHVAVDIELPEDQTITVVAIHAPEGERAATSRLKQFKALKRAVDGIRRERPVVVLGTLGEGVSSMESSYPKSGAGILAGRHTRVEEDDCADAIDVGTIVSTTRDDKLADRIVACGLEIAEADAREEGIVNGEPDAEGTPWSKVPVGKDAERDVSDHYILAAQIKRPRPPAPEPEPTEATEEDEGPGTVAKLDTPDE
jgi:hypothetical protein